eukprot:GFUD01036561.1.p1 GENE.GFUD01036561.1~~GFUD01036561.1.p1  ORF type:complete len:376 (-),score=91.39 GFUD01036561.1:260-1387(-)
MGNVQDVEVGPIRDQRHAEVVAAEYIQNHPEYEWTGQWNATQPGGVSTIQIRRKELGSSNIDDIFGSGNTENRPQDVLPGLEETLQSLQQSLPSFLNEGLNSAFGEQSSSSGQRNLLQQSLNTFLDDTLSSALSPGFGQSASGGQGNTFQQSLTTLLDDTLNIALSSGAGQSVSRGPENSSRLNAASILPSVFEAFNLTNNDQDNDTDDDTDDDNGRFHSYPTTPTGPTRVNSAKTTVNGQTASEVNDLVSKFPEIAESIIRDLLENNDYNVDKTIEDLLKLVPDASNTSKEGTSPKLSSNSSVPTPTCTVCWEALTPPKRIFQCTNGHLVCGVCQRQPQLQGKGCPTCRQPMIGRATAMEQFLADLQKSAKSKN